MSINKCYEMASGDVVVQLGRFGEDPAVFVRTRFPNEETLPPVMSYPELKKWHSNDLSKGESVFLFRTMDEAKAVALSLSRASTFDRPTPSAHIFPDPTLSYDNHG